MNNKEVYEVRALYKIKKIIGVRYLIFLGMLTNRPYVMAFNFLLWIKGIPDRIFLDGNQYVLVSKNFRKWIFFHEKQGTLAYADGIESRVLKLSEEYMIKDLQFSNGDTVIDCGANVGDFSLYFIKNKLDINYHGFEPSDLEFEALKLNLPDHYLNKIGLWSHNTQLKFFVASQNADSSLIKPREFDHVEYINTICLDSYIEDNELTKVKLLKLEAEGAEPEILEGLKNKLHLIEYIAADLGFERGEKAESTFSEVTNFLLGRDFELVSVNHNRVCALYRNKNNG